MQFIGSMVAWARKGSVKSALTRFPPWASTAAVFPTSFATSPLSVRAAVKRRRSESVESVPSPPFHFALRAATPARAATKPSAQTATPLGISTTFLTPFTFRGVVLP
ncbi:MAG: hypothetical protein HZC44_09505 [Geobacter sp.]|nr:hypothetical protein [Geobacter sp.]